MDGNANISYLWTFHNSLLYTGSSVCKVMPQHNFIFQHKITCSSLMMRFLLFPCNTTWACDTSSSGTYGAGTIGRDPPTAPPAPAPAPIITPGAPRPPAVPPAPPAAPRREAFERIMRGARVLASWRLLELEPEPPVLPTLLLPMLLPQTLYFYFMVHKIIKLYIF